MGTKTKSDSHITYVRPILNQLTFFDSLSAGERDELAAHAVLTRYARDQYVFHADTLPTHGYFLIQGLITLVTSDTDAHSIGIEIITESQPFGLLAVVNEIPFPLSAFSLEPSIILSFPARLLKVIIDRHSEIKTTLLEMAASRFTEAQHVIRNIMNGSARTRLAHALILLQRKGALHCHDHTLHISRKQLACLGGTTVETCIRVLKQFEEENLVSLPGTRMVKVLKNESLAELAGSHTAIDTAINL